MDYIQTAHANAMVIGYGANELRWNEQVCKRFGSLTETWRAIPWICVIETDGQ